MALWKISIFAALAVILVAECSGYNMWSCDSRSHDTSTHTFAGNNPCPSYAPNPVYFSASGYENPWSCDSRNDNWSVSYFSRTNPCPSYTPYPVWDEDLTSENIFGSK
ncbi:uncharacterized protein LOC135492816 [Lineus longissimus]|uniref:uncharacterized protein LOC135492816 n=1 Tax=Lineus longissimus TaxID=88925 RepID=UPI002B4F700B